ncbi:hypothetical protein TRFO_18413 [Tritrichomonas foetus]|uniref:DUF3447 domain-containing protein n=1 Tax=Tritrichomonas foetus TaxID=1144522 RepID=A0A1J4KKV4_9EUKA|nr:hypothetical protein TRFO_18413 [Tritrichomonas foetus]|eukprot:OHT11937.1 hypothetical protein TRFO_18413 [Tritrichomonas foetus]
MYDKKCHFYFMEELIIFKKSRKKLEKLSNLLNTEDLDSIINILNSDNFCKNDQYLNEFLTMLSHFSNYRPKSFELTKSIISWLQLNNEIHEEVLSEHIRRFQLNNENDEDYQNQDIKTDNIGNTHFVPIHKIIEDDDIESFQNYVSTSNADLNSIVKIDSYDNKYIKENESFIEYAALFGSINIFKYLWMNNAEIIESDLPEYAVAGGCSDIIHLVEEKLPFSSPMCLEAAVYCFRNDLIPYLFEISGSTFNYNALSQSIASYNYSAFFYMIENQQHVIYLTSDTYAETIFHDIISENDVVKILAHFPDVDINCRSKIGIFYHYFIILRFIMQSQLMILMS